MIQEEKALLLKDLSSRLPYGVKCWASYNKFPTTLVDVNVDTNVGDDLFIITVKLEKTGLNKPSLIEDIKPYLRSMSSMTDDEAKELSKVLNYEFYIDDDFALAAEDDRHRIRLELCEGYIDWLNAHHFDFRGLIEKGLALEAPEGMYKN